MWPFRKVITMAELHGHRKVTVNGMKFTIKRLNPLMDFPSDKVPQIFTAFMTRRPVKEDKSPSIVDLKKNQEEMLSIIEAGVVDPKLVTPGKEGITAADLFRDATLGPKLYIEILAHSLNAFRGIKGQFFFHRIKWLLWTHWLKDMAKNRQILSSQKGALA